MFFGLGKAQATEDINIENNKAYEEQKPFYERIIELYNSFDELVFNLSQNGSESLADIERMDTYRFYKYKQLLSKKLKPNTDAI